MSRRCPNRRHAKEATDTALRCRHTIVQRLETAVTTCGDEEFFWERMPAPFVRANGGRCPPSLCVNGQRVSVKSVVLAEHECSKDLDRRQGYCHSIRHFGRKPSPRTPHSVGNCSLCQLEYRTRNSGRAV